ncbi:MAG: sulfate/molybdate ABC transporter ATP-binding protein [Saprospiraceae bacterium]
MIEINIQKKLNAPSGKMLLDFKTEIEQGQFVTLYGKSGAGKTSTLRILAGLLKPDSGKVSIHGNVLLDFSKKINLPPQKRKIGFVFQDYALFPNMTILENLSFALRKNQSKKILNELIEIMEIGDLQNQKPHRLSGGQQQRVAVARALVQKPELLLLDEPLSALDEEMRSKIQKYILQVHREFNLTTILISHDLAEVLKMSDQVLILNQGKIIQSGHPIDIFSKEKLNGNFQVTGEIVLMEKQNLNLILTILIGKEIAKLLVSYKDHNHLKLGDQILISSSSFQPTVKKLG